LFGGNVQQHYRQNLGACQISKTKIQHTIAYGYSNKLTSGVDQSTANPSANLFLLLKNLYYNKQGPDETVETYAKRFDHMTTSIELAGGDVFHHPGLHKIELKRIMTLQGTEVALASANDIANAKKTSSEAYKAAVFLECADSNRYMTLWQTLRNEALIG
jgi:hypothetical protein